MKKLLALGAVAALLSSCASIAHGTTQPICITSEPEHAKVYVDQQFVGTTPVNTRVSRKDKHIVRLEADGYQPYEVMLQRRMSKWVFGNIVSWGIPGLAVDALSGGLYKIDPNTLHANLDNTSTTDSESSNVG